MPWVARMMKKLIGIIYWKLFSNGRAYQSACWYALADWLAKRRGN